MTNPIQKLHQLGQSLWYDNIERKILTDGTLEKMIQRGEIRGVTSNPSIFNKAIGNSSDYDQSIETYAAQGLSREEIYEKLVVADIQDAADLFGDLYRETGGSDGFVSLEVSPYLAHDTEASAAEAQRLWKMVDRPNLMVKIPATKEGLPAIRRSIAAGININVTLIFSIERYREVMDAFLRGLEDRVKQDKPLEGIDSVASFFISRIETKVDQRLTETAGKNPGAADEIQELKGKAAVANGKVAYQAYQEVLGEENQRFQDLVGKGANRQRILWASTSTKNPDYSDVKYVEEMIGPDSVNTVPQETLDAFRDHGQAQVAIDQQVPAAFQALDDLDKFGIDMKRVTQELEDEGVKSFADAYTTLLTTIEERMKALKG